MDPSEMEQMLEHLITRMEAQIGSLATRMDVNNAESKASQDGMMSEIDDMKAQIGGLADKEESKADKEEIMATIRSSQEETKYAINSLRSALEGAIKMGEEMKACREVTHACLEKKEPIPEEPKAVEETEKVPEGATSEEATGVTED
jgi:hypothetical protein